MFIHSNARLTRVLFVALLFFPGDLVALGQSETPRRESVEITAEDGSKSRATLHLPKTSNPKTAVLIMYSGQSMENHWALAPLAMAGFLASGHAHRFNLTSSSDPRNEAIILDIAAGIRYLKKERGVEHVVLWGWSGGGALMSQYQREAETNPPGRSSATPTGEPPNLNVFDLPKADGIIFHAPILGSYQSMLRRVDPSLTDEDDPLSYGPSLDMFNPANGYRPAPQSSKYSSEFLERFRSVQLERMARIERLAWQYVRQEEFYMALRNRPDFAQRTPEEQRLIEVGSAGRLMVLYRLAADPTSNDLSIDPSDHTTGMWMSGSDPKALNGSLGSIYGGFVVTPRRFLAQRASVAKSSTVDNVRYIAAPTLIVHGTADSGVFLGDTQAIFDALKAPDKKRMLIVGAGHDLEPWGPKAGNRKQREEAMVAIIAWLKERFAM